MIRINLLGTAPPPSEKQRIPKPATEGGMGPQVAVFIVALVVGGGGVVLWHSIWQSQIDKLEKQRAALQRERDRLAQVAAENQRYEMQKRQLEQRINTIEKLEAEKVGPVDVMTVFGNTVNRTNDLYLLTISPQGGRLAVNGESNTVESIARFIAALKESGSFDDVQLVRYYEDDLYNRMSFKFNLDVLYKPPAPPPPPLPTQPAGGPAPPARRAGI
jgi:type IV pilus assembly protein PilN